VTATTIRRKVLVLGGDDIRPVIGVVRSLGRGQVEVHLAWISDTACLAQSSKYVRRIHALPEYSDTDEGWKSALATLMQHEKFDLVIPCSDPVAIPLQLHRRDLEPFGRIYLLNDEVFRIVSDKLAVNAIARAENVNVPREWVLNDRDEADEIRQILRLPIVLKPQYSFDNIAVGKRQKVRKVYRWKDLDPILEGMLKQGPVAVQENFIGQGVGVELLLHKGQPLLEFQHVRVHEPLMGGGSYYRQGVAVTPALREAALTILRPLKYTGVAMVEFKVDPSTGNWVFIEVNGRFWGSLPLAIASGADFPLALFHLLVDGRTEFRRRRPREGLCCRYLSGDLRWQVANVRADRKDPTLATRPLTTVVGETVGNLLTLRERSDTLTLDDPRPGLVELCWLVSMGLSAIGRRFRRKWLRFPFSRWLLRLRATHALKNAKTVLFVCKGNICRSPFAQRVAEQLFFEGRTCWSAGYYDIDGRSSPEVAVRAAASMGVDLSSHRSVRLTETYVRDADAIFVFDLENYERLRTEYSCRGKLHFVGSLSPTGHLWIEDPDGEDLDCFKCTYERIRAAIEATCGRPSHANKPPNLPARPGSQQDHPIA
jgi:protein-tyrosine-phosphatase/predicted ATP-grasp superfamily ATP-dependent carboligase